VVGRKDREGENPEITKREGRISKKMWTRFFVKQHWTDNMEIDHETQRKLAQPLAQKEKFRKIKEGKSQASIARKKGQKS